MKPSLLALALVASLALPGVADAQRPRDTGPDYAEIVRCESVKKRIAYCETRADTRDGVELLTQISDARCVEGRSWGYDRGRIWVDQGCAAEFGVGGAARHAGDRGRGRDGRYDDRGYDDRAFDDRGYDGRGRKEDRPYTGEGRQYVLCESKDNRRRHCAADLRGRRVAVYQNISRIPCVEGSNWGWDDGGVWVDGGCRAEFGITSAGLLQPR